MAGVELVLIKPLLLSYVNHVVVMLNSIFKKIISIRKGRRFVSRSTSANKPTTVKWSKIASL